MKDEVQEDFRRAVHFIRNGPERETTNEQKLKYYSLYKQSTDGDCNLPQPWAFKIEARAKWDAWNAIKGMKKEEAMKMYVKVLTKEEPKWRDDPVVAQFQLEYQQ